MAKTKVPLQVTLTAKAAKAMARRHPWVFSGGIKPPSVDVAPGHTVALTNQQGTRLALGAWSPKSQIRIRIWTFNPDEPIDDAFFRGRLAAAIHARSAMALPAPCTARRLVNAESDGLPGLIVDQYGDFLVCQFLSAGTELWKHAIVHELSQLVDVKGIYERSDADIRLKEGLTEATGPLWGTPPPEWVEVQVDDLRFMVDVIKGHKTGFYLDQRENQALIGRYAQGADILNCFSYSGAFSLWALKAGAKKVINLDASQEALVLAQGNLALNSLQADQVQGNVFDLLRRFRDSRRDFDLIVLDPPKFVASASQLAKGCRGYKDINLLALKLLRPGGVLFTFSCSGLVSPALFQKIIADAALDAGRNVRFIHLLNQAADHPVAACFPEGHYLKGLVCLAD